MALVLVLVLLVADLGGSAAGDQLSRYEWRASSSSLGEPVFRLEPSASPLELRSQLGADIHCLASGSPRPQISWFAGPNGLEQPSLGGPQGAGESGSFGGGDGWQPAGNLSRLRVLANGGATLRLLPFEESDFRPEVHATEYRCVASNPLGAVHSRSVQVQPIVRPPRAPELRLADEFVALGQPAVLRCRLAPPPPGAGLEPMATPTRQLEWAAGEGRALASVGGGARAGSSQRRVTAFATGELHIHQLELADLQRTYSCQLRDLANSSAPVVRSNAAQLIAADSVGRPADSGSSQPPLVLHSVAQLVGWDSGGREPADEEESRLMLPCAARLPPSAARPPLERWLFLPAGRRSRPLSLAQLAASRSAALVVAGAEQQAANASKRARVAPDKSPLGSWSRRQTRLVVGATHLAIEWPRRWLSGRFMLQLEAADEPKVICDTNVIIRSPIKLKVAPATDLSQRQSPLSANLPVAQAQAPRIPESSSSWLASAIGWLMRPLAGATLGEATRNENERESGRDNQAPIRERRSPSGQQVAADSERVHVRGLGLISAPPIVQVGERLQLECRGSGFPIDGVKWFRNGHAINTQTSLDFQVEINNRPLQQQVRLNDSLDDPLASSGELDDADDDSDYADSTAADSDWRLLSVLVVRQVQPRDVGPQTFECFAYNSLGEQARAAQLVLVAERRVLDWARAQCPLARLPSGRLQLSAGGGEEPDEEGDWSAGERRANQLRRLLRDQTLGALVLESEPLELRCPARPQQRVEWHRTDESELGAGKPVAGQSALNGFNQLFGGDSRFVINGSSLQIRAAAKRQDEAVYWCRRDSGPELEESAAGASLHQSSECRRLLLGGSNPNPNSNSNSEGDEATALQLSSISIRIVAKPKINPFEFARNLEEGMRAVVVCAVVSGQSPVDVTWFKDGDILMPDEQIGVDQANGFSSTLTFHRISPSHSGHYTCVAANAFASANHTSRLLVNVAPYFLEPPTSARAILGADLLVDCRAAGTPSPQIRWRKLAAVAGSGARESLAPSAPGGRQAAPPVGLSAAKWSEPQDSADGAQVAPSSAAGTRLEFRVITSNSHIQILENGSMIIKDVELADSSRYACQAFNGVNPSLSEVIDVQVLSPPRFDLNYETVSVKRDAMVKFNCAPRGDQPMRIEWFKEAAKLEAASSGGNAASQQSKYSEIVHLVTTSANDSSVRTSQRHSGLVLRQQPAPSTSQSSSEQIESMESSELFINYADRADSGVFVCVASNPFGKDELTYRLIVQEPPDVPLNVSVQNVQATSLKLLWVSPFDGNMPLTHFIVEYRKLVPQASGQVLATNGDRESDQSRRSEWVRLVAPTSKLASDVLPIGSVAAPQRTATSASSRQQVSQAQFSITLSQLSARSTYHVRVAAANAFGQGGFSPATTVSTAEEPPTSRANELRAQPTSSTSIKIYWRGPSQADESAPVRGYYVSYRRAATSLEKLPPAKEQSSDLSFGSAWLSTISVSVSSGTTYQPMDLEAGRFNPTLNAGANYECLVSGLERSTEYEIRVQPYNSAGVGPASDIMSQTLKFDRPPQPHLKLVAARRQSLELKWSVGKEQPLSGFSLFYKSEYDDWQEIQLALVYHYVIENLRCGNKYQIYLSAFNAAGRSDPSDVLSERTEGTVPIAPDKGQFLRPNISEAELDMSGWQSGGCPISSFVIQFKQLHDAVWFSLSEGATSFTSASRVTVPDLKPATWYKLVITALNEAGSTNAEYLFSTLNLRGEQIAPDSPLDPEIGPHGRLLGVAGERGRSVLRSLSQLLFSSSSSSGQPETQLLLPMSCVLLLLVTSLASYLYYSHHMSASHSQGSTRSTSSSTSAKKLEHPAEVSLERSPSLLMGDLHALGEDKRLLPAQQQANVHLLLNNSHYHQTLPHKSSSSFLPPGDSLGAGIQSFGTQQRARATSILSAGLANAHWLNSSSASTHSTNCHLDASSSQASSSGTSGVSGCVQSGGAKSSKLQLIDESPMVAALGGYEAQSEMSPTRAIYLDNQRLGLRANEGDIVGSILENTMSNQLIESSFSSLFPAAERNFGQQRMGTSSSFVSGAELVQRQQQQQFQTSEPIYQRLEKFPDCSLAGCKSQHLDHFATMHPNVRSQTLRYISSHLGSSVDDDGGGKLMHLTLQRPQQQQQQYLEDTSSAYQEQAAASSQPIGAHFSSFGRELQQSCEMQQPPDLQLEFARRDCL